MEHLGRQGNFRYQKDGGLAFFQAVIDQMDIYAGFAAAGHAEKQSNGSSSRSGQPGKALIGLLLLPVQLRDRLNLVRIHVRPAVHLPLKQLHQLQIDQAFQDLP